MIEKSFHSGTEFNNLKIAYENFRKISFPKPPTDDNLYDLYSELVEFDTYTSGLISSFIKGKKIDKYELSFEEKIKNQFINYKTTDTQTKKEISTYIDYINELNELIRMVFKILKI
jgi:hypothetical protein